MQNKMTWKFALFGSLLASGLGTHALPASTSFSEELSQAFEEFNVSVVGDTEVAVPDSSVTAFLEYMSQIPDYRLIQKGRDAEGVNSLFEIVPSASTKHPIDKASSCMLVARTDGLITFESPSAKEMVTTLACTS